MSSSDFRERVRVVYDRSFYGNAGQVYCQVERGGQGASGQAGSLVFTLVRKLIPVLAKKRRSAPPHNVAGCSTSPSAENGFSGWPPPRRVDGKISCKQKNPSYSTRVLNSAGMNDPVTPDGTF